MSVLGGASTVADLAAMRAARLARLAPEASTVASAPLDMQVHEPAIVPTVAEVPEADVAPREPAIVPTVAEVAEADVAPSEPAIVPTVAEVAETDVAPSFQSLPDGAMFRITANMDLATCAALNVADNTSRISTADALRALREGLSQVKQVQVAATEAIEQERSAERQQQTAEGAAFAQVLQILDPMRNRLQQRFAEQMTELVTMLEQGSQPQQLPEEVETAFAARIAEAAASATTREAQVRSRVADGEMQLARGIVA